jgi:hypothetical protein
MWTPLPEAIKNYHQPPTNPDSLPATIPGIGNGHYHLICLRGLPTRPAWMDYNHEFIYEVQDKKTQANYLKMVTACYNEVRRFPCYATKCLKNNEIDNHYPLPNDAR